MRAADHSEDATQRRSVLLASAYPRDPGEGQLDRLLECARLDRLGRYRLTEDPGLADIILFVEHSHYLEDPLFRALVSHPWVRAYREKTFTYNEHDLPWITLPGLYTSMPAARFTRRRQRAWCYLRRLNPFVGEARDNRAPDLLYSFVGRRSAGVRSRILELRDDRAHLEDSSDFFAFGRQASERHRSYARVLGRSKFVLCPRGAGTSSIRLFETLEAERVPVILADAWVAPDGPDWDACSVRISESDVARLPQILRGLEPSWDRMAAAAAQSWQEWFAPDVLFHRTCAACDDILRSRVLPEAVSQRVPQLKRIEKKLRVAGGPIWRRLRAKARP